MKNIKMVITFSVIALLGLFIFGCSQQNNSTLSSVSETNGETSGNMSASWTKGYDSIEELTDNSDLIALIEVTGISGVEEKSGLYFTTYNAKVIRGINTKEETIKIRMTGKSDDKGKMEIDDDPLMNVGEKWFIFARLNDYGSYTIRSGPYGRFSYNDKTDTVTSLLATNKYASNAAANMTANTTANTLLNINNTSLADVEKQITAHLNKN